MTHYQAALQVLKAAERPLTIRELTDLCVTKGLIVPAGRTPYASMARVLYLRVRKDPELVKVEDENEGNPAAKRLPVRWAVRRAASAATD
jgi:hypothetical protein